MNFTAKGEPLFEQIVGRIRSYVEAGVYAPDEKLPSVREFAATMSVNPKTVVRAYEILEKEGVLYSIQKKGYFVSPRKEERERATREFQSMLVHFSKRLTKEEMRAAIDNLEVHDD